MKEQEKEDNLVTYQSDLVDSGLCDALVTELISCGYSKDTIDESDKPAVHVKDKMISLSPRLPSMVGEFKPKIRGDDLLASAAISLFNQNHSK